MKFFKRCWNELAQYVRGEVNSHGKRSSFNIGYFLYLSAEFAKRQIKYWPEVANVIELLSETYSNEAVVIEHFNKMCDTIGIKISPPPGEKEDEPPGIPLHSEEHVKSVSMMFGIDLTLAGGALNPRELKYGPIIESPKTVLYHNTITISSDDDTVGVKNQTGHGTVVTFFYVERNGAYYLIGMGHHIDAVKGKPAYKIDEVIPQWSELQKKALHT